MEALLDATVRTTIGKNEARRTRREGKVPAIVYGASSEGASRDAVSIAVEPKALLKILHSEAGANTLISLKLDGVDTKVLVKDFQLDPGHAPGAARRLLPRGDGPDDRGHDARSSSRASRGREAPGRHPRVRPPRDPDRVPPERHPGARRRRRDRADGRPGHPPARRRDEPEVAAADRRRHDAGARHPREGGGVGSRRVAATRWQRRPSPKSSRRARRKRPRQPRDDKKK